MAISLITDKACGCITLRNACISIAAFYLISIALNVIIRPSYLTHTTSIVSFIIVVCGNAALLFGALREQKWFVCAWLITAVFFFIGWPIAFFGVIFNYGGYRASSNFDNVFLICLEYIFILALFAYCTHIVWSYFNHLKNKDSQPVHNVVV